MADPIAKAVRDTVQWYRNRYLKKPNLDGLDKIEQITRMRGSLHILYVLRILHEYPVKDENKKELVDIHGNALGLRFSDIEKALEGRIKTPTIGKALDHLTKRVKMVEKIESYGVVTYRLNEEGQKFFDAFDFEKFGKALSEIV